MDQKIKDHFVFCFPYRGSGGVPLLFLRLAKELSKQNYKITLIDYKDGFMTENIPKKTKINMIYYTDNAPVKIPQNCYLIFQTMTPWSIYPSLEIPNKTKLFFITTIPTNLFPALPGVRSLTSTYNWITKLLWSTLLLSEYNKCKKFVKLTLETNSIAFLDSNITCNINYAFKTVIKKPQYIPLFSDEIKQNNYLISQRPATELHLAWVGRIADFKIHILNRTIIDIEKYSKNFKKKIIFYIIGTGNKLHLLQKVNSKNIFIIRKDYIPAQELSDFLLKTHMVFAMGTSALDSAKLGIPTVRLDYSYSKVPSDYLYKNLFEIKGYSLGDNIQSTFYNKGSHTMKDLLNTLQKDPIELSKKTFSFYQKNHNICHSASLFLKYICSTKLSWNDLEESKVTTSKLFDIWKKINLHILRGNLLKKTL